MFVGCLVEVPSNNDIVVEVLLKVDRLCQVFDERLSWVQVSTALSVECQSLLMPCCVSYSVGRV